MNNIVQLKRYGKNPILRANKKRKWEAGAVFNPGAVMDNKGITHLLYRAIHGSYTRKPDYGYENYISVIGHAVSKDGVNFKRKGILIDMDKPYDKYSAEDARVTMLDNEYWITYTGLHSPAFSWKGYRPALASTKDFLKVKKYGIMGPDVNNKDVVIFPNRVNGKIVTLQRIEPNVQIVYYDNIEELKKGHNKEYWDNYMRRLSSYSVLKRRYRWEAMKVGAGPPPIQTTDGWLLIYHGVDERNVYRAGAALFDLKDPTKVRFRAPFPILEPKMKYEREGDVPNVVFPTGAVINDGELFVYYGAADKTCCLATCNIEKLIHYLKIRRSRLISLLKREEIIIPRSIDQKKIRIFEKNSP